MNVIEEVKNRLSIFKNLYDVIRVVDPVEKKTIVINENHEEVIEGTCYGFWKREVSCDNCISMRAYLNNDTFVKIEHNQGKTFLITATPMEFDNKIYVLEILKDIRVSGTVVDRRNENNNVENLICEMNNKIIKDELTKIYNRRYINERLPVDINNSINEDKPLSIIMTDIDFFKNVNNNYGHLIGDKLLQDFAQVIYKSIRKDMDWVARYGGEEFLIVLKNTNSESAFKVSEKIRKLLDESTFKYEGISIHITSSFGLYEFKNEKLNMDELISKADKNLYAAKLGGRNKTIAKTQ